MLTNIYYYDVYRSYMVTPAKSAAPAPKIKTKSPVYTSTNVIDRSGRDVSVKKNNSLKDNIASCAQGIYKSVTDIRETSKYLTINAESYFKNVLDEGFETEKAWALEDISDFVNAVNKTAEFAKSRSTSADFAEYTSDLAGIMKDGADILSSAGITADEESGTLIFDKEVLSGLDYLDFGSVLNNLKQVSEKVYTKTDEFQSQPLAERLDLKDFAYYNYKIIDGKMKGNTFSLIDSGMLLNKAI